MVRHIFVIACVLAAPLAAQTRESSMWERFNWGIHSVTIPAVFLLGVIAGWWLRERKSAEERAREEISRQRADSRNSGGPEAGK